MRCVIIILNEGLCYKNGGLHHSVFSSLWNSTLDCRTLGTGELDNDKVEIKIYTINKYDMLEDWMLVYMITEYVYRRLQLSTSLFHFKEIHSS